MKAAQVQVLMFGNVCAWSCLACVPGRNIPVKGLYLSLKRRTPCLRDFRAGAGVSPFRLVIAGISFYVTDSESKTRTEQCESNSGRCRTIGTVVDQSNVKNQKQSK